jgi:CheY-like chemotaxis protein
MPAQVDEASRVVQGGASSAQVRQDAVQRDARESARLASEAAAQERGLRAGGAIMPRRLLLTISNASLMAQLNSLVRAAGYEARAAFDGQQALDLLRIERPDLLLLDYELHGINGVETLRRLSQQSGGRVTLPVVLLLPSEMESARREALELGAQSVITTPYDPANLLESVRLAARVE